MDKVKHVILNLNLIGRYSNYKCTIIYKQSNQALQSRVPHALEN